MSQHKTVTTRKDSQDAKIKTRAMAKGNRKISLTEAKQKSRQRMVKSANDNVLQDVYENALSSIKLVRGATGLVYDESFANHCCLWDPNYPECPERFTSVINRCREMKLIERCKELKPRLAEKDEILRIHTETHYNLLESTKNCKNEEFLEDLSSNYDAIYIHPSTFDLSLLACGSTIELVDRILEEEVQNGMAIIRPPGHHAMKAEFNGYCFFNNVAVAAQHAMDNKGVKKILIVDWDVHHGQGTQRAFYDDPRVVYFSIHRFEHGTFWPNLRESDFDYVGEGAGEGKNINVPLNKTGMTNADYLAIFQQLLMPVAIEFQPELILISAGYDAALGCQEGEMEVTPACYTHLLSSLLSLATGCVAVVLEGGYCLESLAEGAALTLRTLLGDPCPKMELLEAPCDSIQETILNCIYAHRSFWRNLCLQEVYNIVELNNVNPQKNLHKIPVNSFIGGDPVPEKFATRDCYPVQSETFKREVAEKLGKLKLFTNLSFASCRVCYVYDEFMMEHKNTYEDHPEKPDRIKKIAARFLEYKILNRMKQLESRTATESELALVHSIEHINSMKQIVTEKDLKSAAYKYESVYLHPSTFDCATMSAGSILQVVDEVLEGVSRCGVCVVRPPGHHAESNAPCGFCIFNNISIAAQYAINNFGLKRVLIIDWDIHHGNGTQHIFENDPRVLYISLHRYDHASFFPDSTDADFNQSGKGDGEGFNVNIPWNNGRMGDMEYLMAFQSIILPIAYEFDPELVLVSAGFDAAVGDPLGRYKVSPEAYGYFTHWLSSLAGGKIILALEGGYNVNSISHSMTLCTKSLLGDPLPMLQTPPRWNGIQESAVETIRNVTNHQSQFWKCLKFNKKLPDFNDLKAQNDLVLGFEAMNLSEGESKKESSSSGEASSSSPEAGSSRNVEKKQTLTDYLAENLEALQNQEMFAVVPLNNCPHLSQLRPNETPESFDHTSECFECHTAIENWICLICFKTLCSRYINEHGFVHSLEIDHPQAQNISNNHPLALSFSDLSVWCHKCEAYIDNPQLHKFKNLAHLSKFGEQLVWSYNDGVIDLTVDDDSE